MALGTNDIYLKVEDNSALITYPESYTTDEQGNTVIVPAKVRHIIGASAFNSRAERLTYEAGGKVYHEPKSYEIWLESFPTLPAGWQPTSEPNRMRDMISSCGRPISQAARVTIRSSR